MSLILTIAVSTPHGGLATHYPLACLPQTHTVSTPHGGLATESYKLSTKNHIISFNSTRWISNLPASTLNNVYEAVSTPHGGLATEVP